MKKLKKYDKFFESESVNNRVSNNAEQARKNLPKFINDISELISVNYNMYDLNNEKIEEIIDKYLVNRKGKKIEYINVFNDPKTNIEVLSTYLANIGYSLGYYIGDIMNNCDFDYSYFMEDLMKVITFERIDNQKLSYNGPEILSSSILACSFNIKQSIKNIDRDIEEYDEDEEIDVKMLELRTILGKIYQYGYGLGNDEYYVNVNSIRSKKNIEEYGHDDIDKILLDLYNKRKGLI